MIQGVFRHMNCWASLSQDELFFLSYFPNHLGTFETAGGTTLTDSAAAFPTTGVGLVGWTVLITGGTSVGEWRVITGNTATTLTVAALTTSSSSTYEIFPDLNVQTTVKKYTAAAKMDYSPGNGQCVRWQPSAANLYGAAHGRWFYIEAAPAADDGITIFGLGQGASSSGMIGIDSTRKATIVTSGALVVATGNVALTLGSWYWGAIQGSVHTSGFAKFFVRIYNTSGTLVDEFDSGGVVSCLTPISTFTVGVGTTGCGNGLIAYVDGGISVSGAGIWPPICPDFYASGGATGVGATSQWTSSAGGNKWLDVDDIPHNSDTDYVKSTSTGQTQLFTFPASGLGAVNIHAVGIGHHLRAVSASIQTVQGMTLSSSYVATAVLGTTYGWYDVQKSSTPAGAEWSVSDLDNVVSRVATFGAVATERRCSNVVKFACYGGTYPSGARRRGVVV